MKIKRYDRSSYRKILKEEFELRTKRNGNYSLRAFARDLNLPASQLIEIMSGKKGLSPKRASLVAETLKMSDAEKEYFVNMVVAEHARSPQFKALARVKVKSQETVFQYFSHLDIDKLSFISDWRYVAIYEAANIKGFNGTPEWLVKNLKFKKSFVSQALSTLERLDLVVKERGKLKFKKMNFISSFYAPDEYFKKFHTDILKLAGKRLHTTPSAQFEYISTILSIEKNSLPAIKNNIRKFLADFCKTHDNASNRDSLYSLGIQFFPVVESRGLKS